MCIRDRSNIESQHMGLGSSSIGSLPPLLNKKRLDPKTLDELNNERQALKQQLDKLNEEEQLKKANEKKKEIDEDMLERKKRLIAQRELILKKKNEERNKELNTYCLLYTSPSPRDKRQSRMPSSA
eukprot:TRINITY_DN1127_c0_g1_i1.p4 TRINITY_DN1127_c0_g1~~TRINITY_DN1127_c0_g1_i1.p4  ORF type:complete len:126 (+),score=79.30 TRINITY_DN1127_c0_g1_i1:63-440(+)